MKSGLGRTFNWKKNQLKATIQKGNQYFDYLIDSSFQVANKLFVLSFEHNVHHTRYYIPNIKPKDYYVMIDGEKNFFDAECKMIQEHITTLRKFHLVE